MVVLLNALETGFVTVAEVAIRIVLVSITSIGSGNDNGYGKDKGVG